MTNILFLCGIIMFTAFSCEKDNDKNNDYEKCPENDSLICLEGLILKQDRCWYRDGYYVQILNDTIKIGDTLMLNGIIYDNVVEIYYLPDKFKKVGEFIFFTYQDPDREIDRMCPYYLPPIEAKQIYALCVSDVDCEHLEKAEPIEY